MTSELTFLPVTALAELIGRRQVSPVELVTAVLERVDRHNAALNSYITICHESAIEAARRAERDILVGRQRGPLHGIPVSHKDISWTKGIRTTAHSRTLLDFAPDHDATHVRRLAEAGMILLGKTNMTEFACGGMEIFGTTRNPWNRAYYTGGSSGGSANAVAAGLAVAATGSDTGGSIRVPASFCAIVGLKPTFGRVSRYGVIPLSWSMDQVGPMARTVADCALMLSAMAGYDPRDPTTSRLPVPYFTECLGEGIEGVVLGVPEQHFYEGLDPEVDMAVRTALRQLETLGARLESVDLPRAKDLPAVHRVLETVEAFSRHAGWLRRQGSAYGIRARRRVASGAFFTAAEYLQAAQVRELWMRDLDQVLLCVDAIVTPATPFPAFTVEVYETDPPDTGWNTYPFSLSGHPALSVPCGFTMRGLPIGMQVVTKPFAEGTLLNIAYAYEQSTEWHKLRPFEEAWCDINQS